LDVISAGEDGTTGAPEGAAAVAESGISGTDPVGAPPLAGTLADTAAVFGRLGALNRESLALAAELAWIVVGARRSRPTVRTGGSPIQPGRSTPFTAGSRKATSPAARSSTPWWTTSARVAGAPTRRAVPAQHPQQRRRPD